MGSILPNIFDALNKPEPEKEKKDGKPKHSNKNKSSGNKKSNKTTKKVRKSFGISEETKEKAVTIVNQNIGKEKPATRITNDLADLIEQSSRAELMKPIQLEELQKFKIEQEKMKMMKAAGDVQETPFAEFLYYGYMEKCNLDFLAMCKKLKPRIDAKVKERDTAGVIKLLNKEIKSILMTIKKNQKKDVKEWEKGL